MGQVSDVIVVGAGLAGLTAARVLAEQGRSVTILEAGPRIGGRIHSIRDQFGATTLADLGPTWVWLPYQRHVARWMDQLGLETFAQYETGDAVLDLGASKPIQRGFLPGQHGMVRPVNGPQALVDAMALELPPDQVIFEAVVQKIERNGDGIVATTDRGAFEAKHILCATPLRIAVQSITWNEALPPQVLQVMKTAPTWMAVQAKVIVLYDRPFWRDQGLSGRVASHAGPLAEIHDNSDAEEMGGALFGFLGWLPQQRVQDADRLKPEIEAQLVRCFGPEAQSFTHLHVEDWQDNQHICAQRDRDGPAEHARVLSDIIRQPLWDGQLQFICAETAEESPGLIDGALEAGYRGAMQVGQ